MLDSRTKTGMILENTIWEYIRIPGRNVVLLWTFWVKIMTLIAKNTSILEMKFTNCFFIQVVLTSFSSRVRCMSKAVF